MHLGGSRSSLYSNTEFSKRSGHLKVADAEPVFIMLLLVQPHGGKGSVQVHIGLFVQELSLGEGV